MDTNFRNQVRAILSHLINGRGIFYLTENFKSVGKPVICELQFHHAKLVVILNGFVFNFVDFTANEGRNAVAFFKDVMKMEEGEEYLFVVQAHSMRTQYIHEEERCDYTIRSDPIDRYSANIQPVMGFVTLDIDIRHL